MSTTPSIPGGANIYSSLGNVASNSLVNVVRATRAPGVADNLGPQGAFQIGQRWINTSDSSSYTLCNITCANGVVSATWAIDGGASGTLATLTGDSGTATPSSGNILIAGGAGIVTSASGSTVTIDLDGGGVAVDSIALQTGTTPIAPTSGGLITINGAVVAAGTNPIRTDGTGANTMAVEVQTSQAIAGTDATKIGLCNFSSDQFAVDANGFVTLAGGGLAIDSFTPDAGTSPVVPTAAGVVTMAGTAEQITTTGGTNVLTFSLPSLITAPGSLATTTFLTVANVLTVTAGGATITSGDVDVNGGDLYVTRTAAGTAVIAEVINSDNTNGASNAQIDIFTGGSSSGDPMLSFQISGIGASAMFMGLDNSASDIFTISNGPVLGTNNALTLTQAGALTASTSITATLGNIQATNGNLVLNTAGNKIVSTSVGAAAAAGANSFGTVTLVNGTVTVATTAVTASSIIFLTRQSVGATGANDLGILSVGTITGGTSFVIDAWTVTNATALQADDQSIIGWMIVN